jgi:hypothetical protein
MKQMDAKMTKGNFFRYYNKLAGCHKYLIFFEYLGNIYCATTDRIAPRWCVEARESYRKSKKTGEVIGGGEQKWMMSMKNNHKEELIKKGADVAMTKEEFEKLGDIYSNKGRRCELWLHNKYNLGEHKNDCVRFDKGGDVCIDGVEYQVKFQNASLTNVRTLRNAQKDARKIQKGA